MDGTIRISSENSIIANVYAEHMKIIVGAGQRVILRIISETYHLWQPSEETGQYEMVCCMILMSCLKHTKQK